MPEKRQVSNGAAIKSSGGRAVRRNPASQVANQMKRRGEIRLQMLTWYLTQNLPRLTPDLFSDPPEVIPHSEQGVSNFTFFTTTRHGQRLVIRMKQKPEEANTGDREWSDYHKESVISELLHEAIPVPQLVKEGLGYIESGDRRQTYAYIIQEHLPFSSASTITEPNERLSIFRQLGELAEIINRTETQGFGARLRDESDSFEHATWTDFLQAEFSACCLADLRDSGTISAHTVNDIEIVFADLAGTAVTPTLCHTDFTNNWGNVLVDENLKVKGIIDWEYALSAHGPAQEFAVTRYVYHRNGLNTADWTDEFHAFLEGYGLTPATYHDRFEHEVEALMLIHAVKKLVRYEKMKTAGKLTEHWQIQFALRAEALVQSLGKRVAGMP